MATSMCKHTLCLAADTKRSMPMHLYTSSVECKNGKDALILWTSLVSSSLKRSLSSMELHRRLACVPSNSIKELTSEKETDRGGRSVEPLVSGREKAALCEGYDESTGV